MINITIIGTRGIPAKYGGFETFAEKLAIYLQENKINDTVICDKNSYPALKYKNVSLKFVSTTKTNNPILYYLKGLVHGFKNSDILLVTGTGGSIFYFLNLIYQKIIITNSDGTEFKRSKFSYFYRLYINAWK